MGNWVQNKVIFSLFLNNSIIAEHWRFLRWIWSKPWKKAATILPCHCGHIIFSYLFQWWSCSTSCYPRLLFLPPSPFLPFLPWRQTLPLQPRLASISRWYSCSKVPKYWPTGKSLQTQLFFFFDGAMFLAWSGSHVRSWPLIILVL